MTSTITMSRPLANRLYRAIYGGSDQLSGTEHVHTFRELRALLAATDCCAPTEEQKALLAAGEYTPEELFGAGGKPSCPKCHAAPVQPANGKVEVIRTQYRVTAGPQTGWSLWGDGDGEQYRESYEVEVRHLVDLAHVTQLQAEVERLHSLCVEKDERMGAMNASWAEGIAQRDTLQSELTRVQDLLMQARELIRPAAVLAPRSDLATLKHAIDGALLHAPAPATAERVTGCADAAWLLYDKGFYEQHGVLVMDTATILQKATSYAGYRPNALQEAGDDQ